MKFMNDLRALAQAFEEITGHELKNFPQETTLTKHQRAKESFRLQLSKRFPDLTNKDSDRITKLATEAFWPGVTTMGGATFPDRAADTDILARRDEILEEQGKQTFPLTED